MQGEGVINTILIQFDLCIFVSNESLVCTVAVVTPRDYSVANEL